jgi:isoleucyl-tRNA synthetase
VLEPAEYTLETVVAEASDGAQSAVAMLPGGGFVVLNTALTAELEAEGAARDMIRAIQQARKDANLHVSDRIRTIISAPQDVVDALHANADLVKQETLTLNLELVPGDVETTITVERTIA